MELENCHPRFKDHCCALCSGGETHPKTKPPETVCCSTSSSSVLLWITLVRSGRPLPAATSGSCKCYNPSVFAFRLTHLGTLVTGKFTRIPFLADHIRALTEGFDSKLADAGNPLVPQLGRHLCRPTAD
jgi:hypothetical protein